METETVTELRTCHTCLYLATHEQCDGCLHSEDDYAEYRQTGTMPKMRYANWTAGDGLARIHEWELDGRSSIVIGGQGEADVNVKDNAATTSHRLHDVSEQCGYFCERVRHVAPFPCKEITFHNSEGGFVLVFGPLKRFGGTEGLLQIDRICDDEKRRQCWPELSAETDEDLEQSQGFGARCFYDARFSVLRKALKPANQTKWDSLSYRQKCGFVQKAFENGILGI